MTSITRRALALLLLSGALFAGCKDKVEDTGDTGEPIEAPDLGGHIPVVR